MKKMCAMLAMITAFSAVGTIGVFAEEEKLPALEQSQQQNETKQSQYKTMKGKIDYIEEKDDYYVISVSQPHDEYSDALYTFTTDKNAFIINSKDGSFMTFDKLQNDMEITAIVNKNTLTTLSLPPITSAVGFVVGEENFTATGYFDEEWTSQDTQPMLQLNISEETKIINQMGAKKIFTAQDIQNQDCLVIYGATTRSIPAQTTPVFVMILDKQESIEDIAEPEEPEKPQTEASPEQSFVQDTPLASKTEPKLIQNLPAPKTEPSPYGNFVPLREIAENEGYTVTWTANDKPVILQKDDVTIEIIVGQKDYKKNGEILQAEREAKLMQSKIYISENIIK